jgi:hypothetical protein
MNRSGVVREWPQEDVNIKGTDFRHDSAKLGLEEVLGHGKLFMYYCG